jgi:hypothetical protein
MTRAGLLERPRRRIRAISLSASATCSPGQLSRSACGRRLKRNRVDQIATIVSDEDFQMAIAMDVVTPQQMDDQVPVLTSFIVIWKLR